MKSISRFFRRFGMLYNFRDDAARGRLVMLLSSGVSALASVLTRGLFYTGFLINNGIDSTNIAIISFIPFLASCAALLAPSLLERFSKRKGILASGKTLYYLISVLGATLVPMYVADYALKVTLFVLIEFLSAALNSVITCGYSAWHLNFLPVDMRAEHFSYNTLIVNICSQGFGFLFALWVDACPAPASADLLVAFRYIGLCVAYADVFLLILPREYPYGKTEEHPHLADILTKPLNDRRFARIMLVYGIWTFIDSLPGGMLNYFYLEILHINYSYLQLMSAAYSLFLFLLLPLSRRLLKRYGWLEVLAAGGFLQSIDFLLYGTVTPQNWPIVFTVVQIAQHILNACAISVPFSNLTYMNLPDTDRTNYISFSLLVYNIAAFTGMMFGTWFSATAESLSFSLFGNTLGPIQALLLIVAGCKAVLSVSIFITRDRLRPADGSYNGTGGLLPHIRSKGL